MWASAAEGFFIISGLLVGYVYGPRMARNVLGAAKKMWKRAFLLYALTVVLTFIFVWWGNHSNIFMVKEGLWTHPELGELLFKALTFQYYYGWADFLPYYAIFMAWAPLALYAITRGYGAMVLGISAICWIFRGSSFEMSWQILFMGAMVLGWYLPKIEAKVKSLSPAVQRRLRMQLYGAALFLVLASVLTIRVGDGMVHHYAGFAALPQWSQDVFLWLDGARNAMTPYIVKWTLEPVRLLTALTWFAALYVLVRTHEIAVNRISRGFFRVLGERSLAVYVIHAFTIFALLLVIPGDHGFALNTLMTAGVLVLVYGLAWAHAKATKHSKRTVAEGVRRLQLRNEETA